MFLKGVWPSNLPHGFVFKFYFHIPRPRRALSVTPLQRDSRIRQGRITQQGFGFRTLTRHWYVNISTNNFQRLIINVSNRLYYNLYYVPGFFFFRYLVEMSVLNKFRSRRRCTYVRVSPKRSGHILFSPEYIRKYFVAINSFAFVIRAYGEKVLRENCRKLRANDRNGSTHTSRGLQIIFFYSWKVCGKRELYGGWKPVTDVYGMDRVYRWAKTIVICIV